MNLIYLGVGFIAGISKNYIINFFEKPSYDNYSPLFRQIILEADHYKTVKFDENNKIIPSLYMTNADPESKCEQFRPHIYTTYGPAFKSIISKKVFDNYLRDPSRTKY